jgi:ankyrin repeat protein
MKNILLASALAVSLSTVASLSFAPSLLLGPAWIAAGRSASTQEKRSRKPTRARQSQGQAKSAVDEADEYGRTQLMRASARGDLQAVKDLLSIGADVNGTSGDGYTALMYAAFYGNSSIVEFLLESGADIDAQHESGLTALMEAAKQNLDAGDVMAGYVDTVKALLKKGADVSIEDENGFTALMYAEKYGLRNKGEIVRMLRYAGAAK